MRLLILGALLAATLTATFSAAYFVSSEQASGSVGTGTIVLAGVSSDEQLLPDQPLRPGGALEAERTVRNAGTLDGRLTLSATGVPSALSLQVCEGSDCQPVGTDLGRLDHGAERTFRVRLAWPAGVTSEALQGQTLDIHLTWALRDL